jgi:C1A family cysteine protease
LFPFGPDSFVDEHFENFKDLHGKEYNTDIEHRLRKQVYHNNLRYIMSVNRQKKGYELGVNHLADRFDHELRALHPNKGRGKTNNAMYTFTSANSSKLPTSLDWRTAGAVSEVKDQGICGSCWSFGAAETIEGALFLRTGIMTRLSSQALVDCSWPFGNNGCDGGNDFLAYEWILKSGYIPTEESYKYTMADGYCKYESATPGTSIKGYVNVTSGDAQALREALFTHGPISVSIDASHKSFSFYKSGVYYEPQCGNTVDELDHTVLAVGYGVEADGTPYWIVKNSWSTYWGDQGYVKMSAVNNNCGVATQPTFVIV